MFKGIIKSMIIIVGFAALAACSTGTQNPSGIVDGSDSQSMGVNADGSALQGEGGAAGDGNTVYFDLDKSNIKPQYQSVVDHYASFLSANPDAKVQVGGYTDVSGSREWNLTLSEARAKSVKTALVAQGAKDSQIEVAGYGQEYSVADCAGKVYCWQNRRAVFHSSSAS